MSSVTASPTPIHAQGVNGLAHDPDVDMDRTDAMSTNDTTFTSGLHRGDTRIIVVIYGREQEKVVSLFADVLGKPFRLEKAFKAVTAADQGNVVGIPAEEAKGDITARDKGLLVVINTHSVDLGMPPDMYLSAQCDYEFLYTVAPFSRRDLARFIAHTLGQLNFHETLMAKPRTFFISTTFPDVHAALPNIDIMTVGSDAMELRVDLLKEPLGDGTFAPVPSLSYVGEQVMTLRQKTELPIIFTTRCKQENGRFPMEDPNLFYDYLYRAIQWGIEYIDVEIWLPEEMRRRLWEKKGNSRIMSAFHDFSCTFKWTSTYAEDVFLDSRRYADIVKMIAFVNNHADNFELEYFRSRMKAKYPDAPPLSAVNMGELGQFSRTLNKTFTPITHPLLPIIAAPGQLSAAEINRALALLGQLPKKSLYGITSPSKGPSRIPQAPFYEKCFNELGLPHHFAVVERHSKGSGSMEAWCNQKNFGGAYMNPPMSYASIVGSSSFFASLNEGNGPVLSESARVIGLVDTIVVASSGPASIPSSPRTPQKDEYACAAPAVVQTESGLTSNMTLVFENATWRGILSTLTHEHAPSAYFGRSAVVLASSADDAANVLFALRALRLAKIYTVGFRTPPALAGDLPIEPFNSLENLQRVRMDADESGGASGAGSPFVVVSALGPEKGNLVGLLLRVFGAPGGGDKGGGSSGHRDARKVFLDLASGSLPRRAADPGLVAEQTGFAVYGVADVAAFTAVETLRLLVGQNVPHSFVRLASGRSLYC